MRIFLYILRSLFFYQALGAILSFAIYVLIDLSYRTQKLGAMASLSGEDFHGFHLLRFYTYDLPIQWSISLPAATLLACVVTAMRLQLRGEIAALQSLGCSKLRLLTPFITVGLFTSIMGVGIEQVGVAWGSKNKQLLYHEIERRVMTSALPSWLQHNDWFYYYESYDASRGKIKGLRGYKRDPQNPDWITEMIYAPALDAYTDVTHRDAAGRELFSQDKKELPSTYWLAGHLETIQIQGPPSSPDHSDRDDGKEEGNTQSGPGPHISDDNPVKQRVKRQLESHRLIELPYFSEEETQLDRRARQLSLTELRRPRNVAVNPIFRELDESNSAPSIDDVYMMAYFEKLAMILAGLLFSLLPIKFFYLHPRGNSPTREIITSLGLGVMFWLSLSMAKSIIAAFGWPHIWVMLIPSLLITAGGGAEWFYHRHRYS